VTLHAQWDTLLKVTFNSNGGSAVATKSAVKGKTITAPTSPTKTGFAFKGWYTAASGGSKIAFPYTVTKNVTLHAQWDTLLKVTFNSNGGSAVAAKSAVSGKTITAPTNPTKAGFAFKGWYTAASGGSKIAFPYTVTKNVTLHAQWDVAYPSTYYWKLPWSKNLEVEFRGGYGKGSTHFNTRYNTSKDSAYKRSLAIDFGIQGNVVLYAPTSGTIKVYSKHCSIGYCSATNCSYGNYAAITTKDGYVIYMAHLRDGFLVENGKEVSAGTPIAYMGNTGNSSGQHLHFEIQNVLPNISSGSDYTTITHLFGKDVREWVLSPYPQKPAPRYLGGF